MSLFLLSVQKVIDCRFSDITHILRYPILNSLPSYLSNNIDIMYEGIQQCQQQQAKKTLSNKCSSSQESQFMFLEVGLPFQFLDKLWKKESLKRTEGPGLTSCFLVPPALLA